MITIYVETQRVYSHGSDNMPKIEKILIAREDGLNYEKFLKYLPQQGYLVDRLKVKKATRLENGVEYPIEDTSKWEKMLDEVIHPKTVKTELEAQVERNDELQKRLELLESKIGTNDKDDEVEELKKDYIEKFNKKPFHSWGKEKLIEKLNS